MSFGSAARPWAFAALGYASLTAVFFWPLVAHPLAVPHDLGDPLLNTWILWWNGTAEPLSSRWWNAPAFWPSSGAMAYSEHLLGLAPFAAPLRWMGVSPQLTYNLFFFASFPLSALAAHALCRHLTGRHDAAAIGGLVFGFHPYRLAQIAHLQVLACWWMPLALFALHRAERSGRTARGWVWLAVFGVAWLCQAATNGYFLFFFTILILLWCAWFARGAAWAGMRWRLATAWAVCALPIVPVLLGYRRWHAELGLHRAFGEVAGFGADVASFLTGPGMLALWPFHPATGLEQELYPGTVAVLLIVAGLVAAWRSSERGVIGRRRRVVVATLVAAGVIAMAVGLGTQALGAWSLHAGPVSLGARAPRKPFTVGLVLAIAGLLALPLAAQCWRRRSALAFYALSTLAGWAFCLGPNGKVFGAYLVDKPPYFWFMRLPGADALRVPPRFAMVAAVTLAAAASLAVTALARRGTRWSRLAVSGAAILVALDSWPTTLPVREPPVPLAIPAPCQGPVLRLPGIGDVERDAAAMYGTMFHGRPVVNGYSGYAPEPYLVLGNAIAEGDASVVRGLATFGSFCVAVDRSDPERARWAALAMRAGGRGVDSDDVAEYFAVDRLPQPAEPGGRAVPLAALMSGDGTCSGCLDGVDGLGWRSPKDQREAHELRITLARRASVRAVSLGITGYAAEYPRQLTIETSEDGVAWTPAWNGATGALAYRAAVLNPRDSRITIGFPPRQAALVRLRQLPTRTRYPWSIRSVAVRE